jgi:hypothetical protein
LSARKARQYVKILPDATEKDPKDTSDRVLNKLAWGLFYGTEGVHRSATTIKMMQWPPHGHGPFLNQFCSNDLTFKS